MTRYFIVLAVLLVLPAPAFGAVAKVLLYPGEAGITRHRPVSLSAGEHQILIENLPAGIEANSLRVGFLESKGVRLAETELERIPLSRARAPHIRELETQLRELKDQLRKLEDDREAATLSLDLARRVARQGDQPDAATELEELAGVVREQSSVALKRIREIDFSKRDLEAEKKQVEAELQRYRSGGHQAHRLRVRYHADRARDAVLSIRYQTPDAGWQSHYDARLDTQSDRLELAHRARINQATGENWQDVEIRLATARPVLGGRLPEPRPWILSPRAKPEQRSGFAADSSMSVESNRAAAPARLDNQGVTQRFQLEGERDIADGTRNQSLLLARHGMDARVTTRVVPSLSSRAYIHAESTYEGGSTLPAAPVNLYQDGQYTGEKRLQSLAPGASLTLAFGVDDRVTVETLQEKNRRGDEGLISTSRVIERVTRHDVTNHHERPVSVRVFERLPVADDESIQVEHHDISEPYSEDPDERRGVIFWDRRIPAGGTQSLRYGFTVRVPGDQLLPHPFQNPAPRR